MKTGLFLTWQSKLCKPYLPIKTLSEDILCVTMGVLSVIYFTSQLPVPCSRSAEHK